MRRLLLRGGKCPNRGGMSSVPKSEEGKRRVTQNLPSAQRRLKEMAEKE
jgi:hypothetical protein